MPDIGGGTGSWTMAAARGHPELTATVLDLPVAAEIARAGSQRDAGLGRQVESMAGDALAE